MVRTIFLLIPMLMLISILPAAPENTRPNRPIHAQKTRTPAARDAHAVAASISEMLDDFHDAAARADEARYFGHFAPNAIFLGTDPAERWTVDAFRTWARPYFERDSAWTYVAIQRHVQIGPSGMVGWFDEVVRNKTYGDLRGSGVVVRTNNTWKIAQYNLTFMIPNEKSAEVLTIIKP